MTHYKIKFLLPIGKTVDKELPYLKNFLLEIAAGYQKTKIEGFYKNKNNEPFFDELYQFTIVTDNKNYIPLITDYLRNLNSRIKEESIYLEISEVSLPIVK